MTKYYICGHGYIFKKTDRVDCSLGIFSLSIGSLEKYINWYNATKDDKKIIKEFLERCE